MRRRLPVSVRTALTRPALTLIAPALLAAILVGGLVGLAARLEAPPAGAEAWERAAGTTRALEDRLKRHLHPLNGLAASAQAMVAAGAVDPRWAATMDPFAEGLMAGNARLAGLAVVMPDGRVRRYERGHAPHRESWQDRPALPALIDDLLTRARDGHTAPVWGRPVARAGSGHALFNIRVPLLDRQGRPRAVLLAMVDLEPLSRALPAPADRAADQTPYVLVGNHALLAHPLLTAGDAEAEAESGGGGGGRPLRPLAEAADPALAALATGAAEPLHPPIDIAPARARVVAVDGRRVIHVQRVLTGFGPDPLVVGVHMPAPEGAPPAVLVPLVAALGAGLTVALAGGAGRWARGLWDARRTSGPRPTPRRGTLGAKSGAAPADPRLAHPVEETEASVLVIRVREAATLLQVLPPPRAMALLGALAAEAATAVEDRGGTLVRAEGGLLMAVFNLPRPLSGHADHAVEAAKALQGRLAAGVIDGPALKAGMGIATGTVLAGPVGPATRPAYGILGPGADLAEALAAMTERVGADILVSDHTAALVAPGGLVSLGKLPVAGQGLDARVYTPGAAPRA
jgi:class 3 adenylate cyclase